MGFQQVFHGGNCLKRRKGDDLSNEELTSKYVSLDERVTRHTEQIKTCFNQIDEAKSMAESVHKLATTVEILVREQQSTNEKMDKLTHEVEEIKEKPAKRWDSVTTVIYTAVVTAVITYILTQLGLR